MAKAELIGDAPSVQDTGQANVRVEPIDAALVAAQDFKGSFACDCLDDTIASILDGGGENFALKVIVLHDQNDRGTLL